jgi:hypothetical protein
MNSVTLRLVAVIGVLVLEAVLIILNNPVVNLVASIILLGVILFLLVRWVLLRRKSVQKDLQRNKAGDEAAELIQPGRASPGVSAGQRAADGGRKPPAQGSRPGIFTAVGRRIKKLSVSSRLRASSLPPGIPGTTTNRGESGSSAKTAAQPGDVPSALSPKSRFETFRTMRKGLKLLFASRSRNAKTPGSQAAGITTDGAEQSDRPLPTSLASIDVETISPMGQKREPSPFSSMEKDMVLDADLVLSRQEKGKDAVPDMLISDIDVDSMEIFAQDSDIAHMDLSLDSETSITIDEDEDDEVAQILDAHHDELVKPAPEMEEFSIDKELDALENFDLDLVEVDPGGGSEAAGATRDTVTPPGPSFQPETPRQGGTLTKSAPDRTRADDTMLAFSSGSAGGDDDLLSSLRSDITGKKHKIDQSLVRDLKDVRVQIGEIEKDITELLVLYKKFE